MTPKRVVIIFPKYETYEFKQADAKFHMREQVKRRLKYYQDIDILSLYCFVEDKMAYRLLPELLDGKTNVKYLSCFNSMDIVLWRKSVMNDEKYPALYKDALLVDIIKEAASKAILSNDSSIQDHMPAMISKRRAVVSAFINSPEFIVLYFDKNNQYCNLAKPVVGDTRLVHTVNLNEDSDTYCYSGQYVDKDLFLKIIEEG